MYKEMCNDVLIISTASFRRVVCQGTMFHGKNLSKGATAQSFPVLPIIDAADVHIFSASLHWKSFRGCHKCKQIPQTWREEYPTIGADPTVYGSKQFSVFGNTFQFQLSEECSKASIHGKIVSQP